MIHKTLPRTHHIANVANTIPQTLGILNKVYNYTMYSASIVPHFNYYNRAVANGPVGPAMAGPIIEPAIKKTLITFLMF